LLFSPSWLAFAVARGRFFCDIAPEVTALWCLLSLFFLGMGDATGPAGKILGAFAVVVGPLVAAPLPGVGVPLFEGWAIV
jgi:hypothetical protein